MARQKGKKNPASLVMSGAGLSFALPQWLLECVVEGGREFLGIELSLVFIISKFYVLRIYAGLETACCKNVLTLCRIYDCLWYDICLFHLT